jgi:hypothetical protein
VPSQQPKGQLQTEYIVKTGNYIIDKHSTKTKTNYRQALVEENNNSIQFFIISIRLFIIYEPG